MDDNIINLNILNMYDSSKIIYKYKSLRKHLIDNDVKLKTYSDTEVILELFALEGPQMVSKLKGMFAFVIWDCKKKEAFAARDPYGIKPLFIGTNSEGVILASQVKTLLSTKQISLIFFCFRA